MTIVGDKIKEVRAEAGLTQEQFAMVLGLKRTAIVGYESGNNIPPTKILEKISTIYNVSVDWLLTGEGNKYKGPGRELDWEATKEFFERYPDIEEKKPGLYRMLEEADYREEHGIKENEAEYLAQVDIIARGGEATTEMWVIELKTYRDRQAELQIGLTSKERKIILNYRLLPEDLKESIEGLIIEGAKFVQGKKEEEK